MGINRMEADLLVDVDEVGLAHRPLVDARGGRRAQAALRRPGGWGCGGRAPRGEGARAQRAAARGDPSRRGSQRGEHTDGAHRRAADPALSSQPMTAACASLSSKGGLRQCDF